MLLLWLSKGRILPYDPSFTVGFWKHQCFFFSSNRVVVVVVVFLLSCSGNWGSIVTFLFIIKDFLFVALFICWWNNHIGEYLTTRANTPLDEYLLSIKTKICSKCSEIKPLIEFHSSSHSKDGKIFGILSR